MGEKEDPVGHPAVSGAGVSPPADPEPGPPSKPDDRLDALLLKLELIDPKWGETFSAAPAINPKSYARLQRLMNRHGYTAVRKMMEYAVEKRIKPNGPDAMPIAVSLCKAMEPKP